MAHTMKAPIQALSFPCSPVLLLYFSPALPFRPLGGMVGASGHQLNFLPKASGRWRRVCRALSGRHNSSYDSLASNTAKDLPVVVRSASSRSTFAIGYPPRGSVTHAPFESVPAPRP